MQFQEFLLQVVFVLWVFFVMLVLNNLLNGLAVQDIGEIQRDCEVVSAASQVELVAFIESMLLGDPFQVNKVTTRYEDFFISSFLRVIYGKIQFL